MEILRNTYWVMTYERALHLVRAVRTPTPFTTAEEMVKAYEEFSSASKHLPRKDLRLLLDVREGPMRNDEAFDQVLNRYRAKMFENYATAAVLVKTAIGKLQATRINKMPGGDHPVFNDEKAALAYLASNGTHGPPSSKPASSK